MFCVKPIGGVISLEISKYPVCRSERKYCGNAVVTQGAPVSELGCFNLLAKLNVLANLVLAEGIVEFAKERNFVGLAIGYCACGPSANPFKITLSFVSGTGRFFSNAPSFGSVSCALGRFNSSLSLF